MASALIGAFWACCETLWGVACFALVPAAEFVVAMKRACHQRMRRAIGLPPLPEIPADPAE